MEELNYSNLKLLCAVIQKLIKKLNGNFYYAEVDKPILPNSSTYIQRKVDLELYGSIKNLEGQGYIYCVSGSPQSGKSSLLINFANQLAESTYVPIIIQFKCSVTAFSGDEFYSKFTDIFIKHFNTKDNDLFQKLQNYWQKQNLVKNQETFQYFLQYLLEILGNRKLLILLDDFHFLPTSPWFSNFVGLITSFSNTYQYQTPKVIFVLTGCLSQYSWLSLFRNSTSLLKILELQNFTKEECTFLLSRLEKSDTIINSGAIFNQIVMATGGQPFLSQYLCDLVIKNTSDSVDIKKLTEYEIRKNWDNSKLKPHILSIEQQMIRGDPVSLDYKLLGLQLYEKLLNQEEIEFKPYSRIQADLLVSGLVQKDNNFLKVTHSIYANLFNEAWIQKAQQLIVQRSQNKMASPKLFNREVYMLIDQSGTMVRKDDLLGGNMRWKALSEVIEGHTFRILNEKNPMDGTPLCDEIVMTFFSPNVPCPKTLYIQDSGQIEDIFQSNYPDGNTFVTPTLNKVINLWKDRGRNEGKGAIIIIYVDGQFDDRDNFINLVESTCNGLKSQDELKIVILGYGSEFKGCSPAVEFYLKLDLNTSGFTDSKGINCNIVVFDRIQNLEGIIDPLNRQLDNPEGGIAGWAKTECPHLFK